MSTTKFSKILSFTDINIVDKTTYARRINRTIEYEIPDRYESVEEKFNVLQESEVDVQDPPTLTLGKKHFCWGYCTLYHLEGTELVERKYRRVYKLTLLSRFGKGRGRKRGILVDFARRHLKRSKPPKQYPPYQWTYEKWVNNSHLPPLYLPNPPKSTTEKAKVLRNRTIIKKGIKGFFYFNPI